jgi:dGTPase
MLADGGFGANPQNLRIVRLLEKKYRDCDGLNLTRATLDGLLKYKDPFDSVRHAKSSKFLYTEDRDLLEWIGPATTSIEGEIADWADQVAYSVDDIEDNIRAGIFDPREMQKRSSAIAAKAHRAGLPINDKEVKHEADQLFKVTDDPSTERERKVAMKAWTSSAIFDLIKDCEIKVRDSEGQSNRYKYTLFIPESAKRRANILRTAASILVFENPRVTTLEHKGKHLLESLVNTFAQDPSLLPYDYQELIKNETVRRTACDFVAGMTDHFAAEYYARLSLPGEGSFYQYI